MTLKGYDAWRLQGQADDQCPDCYGHKTHDCMNCGGGHSNMVSVAIQPKLFLWDRESRDWLIVVLGVRIHRKRNYGGIFA